MINTIYIQICLSSLTQKKIKQYIIHSAFRSQNLQLNNF